MTDKPYFSYPLPSDTGKPEFVLLDAKLYMIFSRAMVNIVKKIPSAERGELCQKLKEKGAIEEGDLSKDARDEIDTTANLMVFGASVAVKGRLFEPEERRLRFIFSQFLQRAIIEQWTQEDTDPALSICFFLVHNKHMTYREAFNLEQVLLGRKRTPQPEPSEVKVFRRRLSRWADAPQRKLERVAKIGRPPKQKASDSS